MKAILDKEMDKNKKLLREKELLEEKVERVNQIKQESSDIQVYARTIFLKDNILFFLF